jgi:predicted secreted Zn-dependent protease
MALRILPAGAIVASVHYTYTDQTLADLVASMSRHNEPAEAKFEFELSFDHAAGRLTNVELTMWLTIAMPEWTEVGTRPQRERTEWSRFLRALRHHEDGHIDIFRAEAPTAMRALEAATPRTINSVLAAQKRRIQRLSNTYDTQTGHGTRQQTPDGTTIINVP